QPERMLLVGNLDQVDMVRELRQRLKWPLKADRARRRVRNRGALPLRAEAELSIGMAEAVDVVRCLEFRLDVDPTVFLQRLVGAVVVARENAVDVLALGETEARLVGDPQ